MNSIDVTLGIDLAVRQDMTFDACVRVPLAHPLVPDGGYVMFGLALHVAIGE